ncbi:MAG TPA: outer membrane beta-barrel protein [Steroidobacteraceae bacterium]|nr:outer membrane beta-barrel protein [Steroidobacteraceae bacterium]
MKADKIATCVALISAAAPKLLLATDAPMSSPPEVPSWADTLNSWGVAINGYVAASYYASNGYPGGYHEFDENHNTFQLDQAGLTVAYQPKQGFGAVVDLMAGEDARIVHASEDGHDNSFDVRQAFVQYATGPLTIIGGKYVTLAGAEVINPTQNTNFSRSLLFTLMEPLTHTGVRATLAASDTVSFIAGINNGWNTTSTSYGPKTGELGIAWTPSKTLSLTAQAYLGKFGATLPTPIDANRTLVDVVATYNATSSLTFLVNADWDKQADAFGPGSASASWYGLAGYANYALNSQWRVSLRLEYLEDKDGFVTGVSDGQHLWESTVTFGYAPTKNFELRLEGRYDDAQRNTFVRSQAVGTIPADLENSLSELAVQGVYKF